LRNGRALAGAAFLLAGVGAFGCSSPPAMHAEEPPAAPVQEPPVPAPSEVALIPAPAAGGLAGERPFVISGSTRIHVGPADAEALRLANDLARLIPVGPGQSRPVSPLQSGSAAPGINLLIDASLDSLGAEGYRLTIAPDRITATAARPAGLFYAIQTLRQLLPVEVERGQAPQRFAVAAGDISDRPRFEWRGAMLDVSRHFLKPADVKRFIDVMALYKLNRLHLHLADDQGWRIEIKSWPNLARHGGSTAVGGGAGGFYTQAEYSDLVEYASMRFIMIVPEIDMPGHINAALASYAELNCDGRARELYTGTRVGFSSLCVTKDITYKFVDDVIREISALTPGPWFHIGGDEVKTLTAQQYGGFIDRVQSIVQSHGKVMIGWDEIGEAKLAPTTIVQYWRPNAPAREAIAQGARFILSPAQKVYLDMKYDSSTALGLKWAGYVDVRTSYDWDPARLVAGISESAIVGVEAPLWAETVVTLGDYEYMAFPRLAAVAELGWSPQQRRTWEDFRTRLGAHGPRLSALGVNYYRSPQIPWR
ncbi:MAG: beta-N-acetylhexosaminidase, partial [Gemmatimonadaceae bacterium]|nr:beta-N-acetylhexosaminidase [Gemmatimonadaceae bacterium]